MWGAGGRFVFTGPGAPMRFASRPKIGFDSIRSARPFGRATALAKNADLKFDGFVKSPSAALRFIFCHSDVLISTPHS